MRSSHVFLWVFACLRPGFPMLVKRLPRNSQALGVYTVCDHPVAPLLLTWVGPPAAGPRRSTRSCRRAACLRPGFPMLPDFQRVPTVSDPTCGFTPCSHTLPPSNVYNHYFTKLRGFTIARGWFGRNFNLLYILKEIDRLKREPFREPKFDYFERDFIRNERFANFEEFHIF